MALAFKAAGTAVAGSGTTVTPAYPASKASGDLAIILVESGNGATPADPTGFTLVGAQGVGAGGSEVGGTRLMIYRRTLDGSEGSTVTVNRAAGHTNAIILLYTGHDTTTPITISTGKQMTPATTSLSTNGIASAAGDGNALFLACYATDRDSPTPATLSSSAFANASGSINNRVNASDNLAGGGGIIAEELDPSSNSTGTVSHSITADSTIATSFLLRINAATGTPTTKSVTAASVAIAGQAIKRTGKRAIIAASVNYSGQSLFANIRKRIAVIAGAIAYAPQAIAANAKTLKASAAATITMTGQAITVNARRRISVGVGAIAYAGQTVLKIGTSAIDVVKADIFYSAQTVSSATREIVTRFGEKSVKLGQRNRIGAIRKTRLGK